jgi:dGTPase
MRGNVIHGDDLPKESREYLGESSSDRIDTMVRGVIQEALNDSENKICFSEGLEYHIVTLRDFLYDRVYDSVTVHQDFLKCSRIIEDLYNFFLRNHDAFLEETGRKIL